MEKQLQDKLTDAGVSIEAINILIEQELSTEERLRGFTYDRLVAFGIKAGSAKILADMYGPKESPRHWFSKERRAPISKMSVRELFAEIAAGNQEPETVQALREKIGNRPFIAVGKDGGVDPAFSAEAWQKRGPLNPKKDLGRIYDHIMQTLDQWLGKQRWAHPLNLEALEWGDNWTWLADNHPTFFKAAHFLCATKPQVVAELKEAGLWAQCDPENPGTHIKEAITTMEQLPEWKDAVVVRMRYSGREGDCGDPPASARR